jgi:bifunctional polynucleotide phosphatase/kinase
MDIELLTISEYNLTNTIGFNKIASFDFDWTLVKPKDNRKFPKTVDDWQWLFPSIPSIIKQLYNDGYIIVIFTNQSKEWKKDQIMNVVKTLDIPIHIAIAFEKKYYKPDITLYNKISEKIGNIDKENSFFVGDALGRKDDFSDSDKVFAENIGIKWLPPEDIFYKNQKKLDVDFIVLPDIPLEKTNKEVIIMVGYPGSGKSTIADSICEENDNYICIKGDEYKTSKAMIKKASEYTQKSIIFDATNGSIKKRAEYIEYAKKYNYTVIKCIHVSTSMEDSYQRNKQRPKEKQVPRIAYSVYKKHFEEPNDKNEGFILYNV